MPHEISRVLRAVGAGPWFIEPTKAEQIVNLLSLRAAGDPRAWSEADKPKQMAGFQSMPGVAGPVHVLRLFGTIMPRANMMTVMSGAAAMTRFQADFRQAAADEAAAAIVIEVDSPGGMVDMVPETAAMVYAARRAGRPIVAVANTMAASAAYWIASAADELVVTPSGQVGSIGVYVMHDDMSERLAQEGIARTFIFEGPRKVENHPFGPMTEEGRADLQRSVRETYEAFTADVAKFRGVAASIVRADPEGSDRHFGGGRVYRGKEAVRLGMADRVETFEATLSRVASRRGARRAGLASRALGLI